MNVEEIGLYLILSLCYLFKHFFAHILVILHVVHDYLCHILLGLPTLFGLHELLKILDLVHQLIDVQLMFLLNGLNHELLLAHVYELEA